MDTTPSCVGGVGGCRLPRVPCLEDPLPGLLQGALLDCQGKLSGRLPPTVRRGGEAGEQGGRERGRGERPTLPGGGRRQSTGPSLWSRPALCWRCSLGEGRPRAERGRPAPTWFRAQAQPWLLKAVSLVALAPGQAPGLESDGRAHLSRPWGSNASDAPGNPPPRPPAPRTAQLPPSLGALLEGSQLPGRRDNLVLWGPRCSGNILGERGLKCPPHCPKDLTLVRAGNLEAACQ